MIQVYQNEFIVYEAFWDLYFGVSLLVAWFEMLQMPFLEHTYTAETNALLGGGEDTDTFVFNFFSLNHLS